MESKIPPKITYSHWNQGNDSLMSRKKQQISLFRTIKTEISQGKYQKARDLLMQNQNQENQMYIKKLLGLLERIEGNFIAGKNYYYECLEHPKIKESALLAIGKIHIELGEVEMAEKTFESLTTFPNMFNHANLELSILYIMRYHFYEAEKVLENLDSETEDTHLRGRHKFVEFMIDYYLGRIKENELNGKSYLIHQTIHYSDEKCLKHIEKHYNQKYRYGNGCFLEFIDAKKLYRAVKERIEEMNPNYFELSDLYRIHFDSPIGYKGEELTQDLGVVTTHGTKNILTMYPIQLSTEYDREKLIHSKELKIKRLQGGLYND